MIDILAKVIGIIVRLRVALEIVLVEHLKGKVWLHQDVDVQIHVTQKLTVKGRRQVEVAIETPQRTVAITEAKNVVPAIQPIVFSAQCS